MLVNLKEILAHAEQENYTVLAANIFNMESLLAIAGAAEKEHAPIIMNIGQMRMRDEKLGSILTHAACELGAQVEVPVCINLDHGTERAVYMKAMDCGCTSIMVDGSMLSYEENVALTKEMVEIAHQRGISVEGEIGHVGQGADYTDLGAKDLLTAPEIARKFAEATGVDRAVAREKNDQAQGSAKTAITMILADCGAEEARERLARAGGQVREAIR